jgi:hypothetical protein
MKSHPLITSISGLPIPVGGALAAPRYAAIAQPAHATDNPEQ